MRDFLAGDAAMPDELALVIACRPVASLGDYVTFAAWPEAGGYYDQDAYTIDAMTTALRAYGIYRPPEKDETKPALTLADAEFIAWMSDDDGD